VVTGIAGLTVLFGLFLAVRGRSIRKGSNPKRERARLLDELEDLERAHATGEIGPRTYERARRAIVDAIARTIV
jgi:hypothetical protein